MKKITVGLILLLTSISSEAETVDIMVGHWQGIAVRQGSAQVFNFNLRIENEQLVGDYEIPDWGLFREPLKEIKFESPHFSARFMYGTFEFTINPELQEMTGGNESWNPPITAHIKKIHLAEQVKVTPVSWLSAGDQQVGQLLEPAHGSVDTLVVVLPGSGKQGLASWPYRSYADFFAQNNYGALVFDKRGVGDSVGDFDKNSFESMTDDVLALLNHIKKEMPQFTKVGLFGISQGTWIATKVASKKQASQEQHDLAFVVLSAGPAVSVKDQELQAVEYQMKAADMSAEDIEQALNYTRQMFEVAYHGKGWPELEKLIVEIKPKPWAEYVSLAEDEEDLRGWLDQKYDPTKDLQNLKIPVLAFLGDQDVLVPSQENAALMREYIEHQSKPKNDVVIIKNVGHNMSYQRHLVNNQWQWPESYWHWGRKAPEYYGQILAWMNDL